MRRQSTAAKKPRSTLAHPEEGIPGREETFEWLCENLATIVSLLFDMPQDEIDGRVADAFRRWQEESGEVVKALEDAVANRELSKTSKASLKRRLAQVQNLVRSAKAPSSLMASGSASLLDWTPAAVISPDADSGRKRTAYVDIASRIEVIKSFEFGPVPEAISFDDGYGYDDDEVESNDYSVSRLLAEEVVQPRLETSMCTVAVWFDVRASDFAVSDLLRELRDLEALEPSALIAVVSKRYVRDATRRLLEKAGFGLVALNPDGDVETTVFRSSLPD